VPVETTDILKASHFFVGEISDDFKHAATVAINTEDVVVEQLGLKEAFLEDNRSNEEAADNPLSIFGIVPQKSFHI
jgi:hypothetical protein